MSAPEDSTTVRYTAKELFSRIDQKLDVIANQLTAKADHEALVATEVRIASLVAALDVRVTVLETELAERKGFNKAKAAIAALVFAVGGLTVPFVLQLVQ